MKRLVIMLLDHMSNKSYVKYQVSKTLKLLALISITTHIP